MNVLRWLALVVLLALLALHGWYFVGHIAMVLAFPYPLDYGEGPLLQQARQLAAGSSVAQLYANPAQPPYNVVNYPPLYLLLTRLIAPIHTLLFAGRILSLLATIGCALALAALIYQSTRTAPVSSTQHSALSTQHSALGTLQLLIPGGVFFVLPVVHWWAALMRVDLLGICLGLWALVALAPAVRASGLRWFVWNALAALLLTASLYTKPSLVAAPLAACFWLVAQRPLRGLVLVASIAMLGGTLFVLLQIMSGGWFAHHIVSANANTWQLDLALQFWREQLPVLGPLALAASVGLLLCPKPALLPLLYTVGGLITAVGVGKVGAYANYFLELEAGLLWMAGLALAPQASLRLASLAKVLVLAILALSLVRYSPVWDKTEPRLAGIVSPNPPRLAFGSYGVWADLQRQHDLLAVFEATQDALNVLLRAEQEPLLTDTPGLLVAAEVPSRLQAFEHRQLLDQGLWDQEPVLRELANGTIPLAAIDHLGNWLSPEMVTLLRHRYAQDGSVGTTLIYRPVAVGPLQPALAPISNNGLRLVGYRLAPSLGQSAYHAGETLALVLEWQRVDTLPPDPIEVTVALHGAEATQSLQLLYGALPAQYWPANQAIQHMHPLELPLQLRPGRYELTVALHQGSATLLAAQPFATIAVEPQTGAVIGEHYVPAPFLAAWRRLGGSHYRAQGLPLMPAVPFAGGVLQCFERACLEFGSDGVTRRPLGAMLARDAPRWPLATLPGDPQLYFAETGQRLAAIFATLWYEQGGEPRFGPPVTQPLGIGILKAQFTYFARFEQAPNGTLTLGRLGAEYLRLAPGIPYGWPTRP